MDTRQGKGKLFSKFACVQILSAVGLTVSLVVLDAVKNEHIRLPFNNQVPKDTAEGMVVTVILATFLSIASFFVELGYQRLFDVFRTHRNDPSTVGMTKNEANDIRNIGISVRIFTGGVFLGVLTTAYVWMSADTGKIIFYAMSIVVSYLLSISGWVTYMAAVYNLFSINCPTSRITNVEIAI